MTVSTNPTPDFQRDQILTAAIRKCGLLTAGEDATAEQISDAAVHFNLSLQDLQSEGIALSSVERATLALISGTAEYALPVDVIDVELGQDDAIGTIISSDGTTETIVKTMSRGEWMNIAQKTTLTGRPSRCYIEKLALVTAVFWPIPDSSLISFRYAKVRLLRGGNTGADTMDLFRTWTPYILHYTASGVAYDNSKPDLGATYMQIAQGMLAKCKAGDVQHGAIRFRAGHQARNW
jgi:hypothetical protein